MFSSLAPIRYDANVQPTAAFQIYPLQATSLRSFHYYERLQFMSAPAHSMDFQLQTCLANAPSLIN